MSNVVIVLNPQPQEVTAFFFSFWGQWLKLRAKEALEYSTHTSSTFSSRQAASQPSRPSVKGLLLFSHTLVFYQVKQLVKKKYELVLDVY